MAEKKEPSKRQKIEEKISKSEKAAQTKRERKAEYRALKQRVLEFEESNFGFLILIRERGSNWWKAFGHSAIFLSTQISKRVKRKYNLGPDTDFGAEDGAKMVSIKSIGALKAELKVLHIYPVLTKENSIRFQLDEPITHEAYKDALGEDDRLRERANKVFAPKHLVPILDDEIKKLQRQVRILADGLKSPEREAYGTDMRKVAVTMTRLSARLAHDRIEMMEFLEREKELLFELDEFANVVMNDGPYDLLRMAKFAEQYTRVEAELERETRLQIAKNVEEEMKGKAQKGNRSENSRKDL